MKRGALKESWAAILLLVLMPFDSDALEKRARIMDLNAEKAWSGGCSFRLNYYNICTGWVWSWSGWDPGDQFGMVLGPLFWSYCDNSMFLSSAIFTEDAAPPGYGFTGTIELYNSSASGCTVGPPIVSQPFLSQGFFTTVNWGGALPYQYAAIVMTIGPTDGNPMSFGTDHPAAGPTGPNGCGSCYPADRVGHSFLYQDAGNSLCPASAFNDGVCDAELFWDTDTIGLNLDGTVSVEGKSWGQIKNLYR